MPDFHRAIYQFQDTLKHLLHSNFNQINYRRSGGIIWYSIGLCQNWTRDITLTILLTELSARPIVCVC